MKFIRSLSTLALSAASVSSFAGPSVVQLGRTAAASTTVGVQQRRPVATSSPLQMASSSSSASDFVTTAIADHKVVVFSKSYCPYCTKTKELLAQLNVDATIYELNDMGSEGADIQEELLQRTGQRTVPSTFIGGQHVGGNDSLQSAHRSGELQTWLVAAAAAAST